MNTAIAFLCVIPSKTQLDFLKQLTALHDVFVVCDSNENLDDIKIAYPQLTLVQVSDEECINDGFANACGKCKPATSWEKALWYFAKNSIKNEYVWFIEDDVFIPDVKTLHNLDKKYDTDLLAQNISPVEINSKNWKFLHIRKYIDNVTKLFTSPWYKGLVCAARFSKKLLNYINDYALKHKTLCFIEILFHTTAKQHNLKITLCPELKLLRTPMSGKFDYAKSKESFSLTFLYHPIKDRELHASIRQTLQKP